MARAAPAAAENGAGEVQVVALAPHVDVGGSVTVEVWLEGEDYYGLDIRLSYDADYLSVPAWQVTPLWEVFDANSHFIIRNWAGGGTIWYAVANLNPAQPFTGRGRVCTLTFRGLADGVADLRFTYAKGSARAGTGLYPKTVNTRITVGTGVPAVRWRRYLPSVMRLSSR